MITKIEDVKCGNRHIVINIYFMLPYLVIVFIFDNRRHIYCIYIEGLG